MSIQNLQISEAAYLWIFLAFLEIHLTEEFLGGIRPGFDSDKLHGMDLSPIGFVRTNMVAAVSLAIGIVLALRLGFPQFVLVSLSTFMLVNAGRHCVKSIKDLAYSPGLITAILVFIPLGAFTLLRLEPRMKLFRFGLALGLGLIFQFGASFIAHRGRQFVDEYRGKKSRRAKRNERVTTGIDYRTISVTEDGKG
jgi:hypothetical protein